jgi:hypothetical protein
MIETKEIMMDLLPVITFGCGMLLGGLLTSKGNKININLKILNNSQNENIEQKEKNNENIEQKEKNTEILNDNAWVNISSNIDAISSVLVKTEQVMKDASEAFNKKKVSND